MAEMFSNAALADLHAASHPGLQKILAAARRVTSTS